MIFNGAPPDEVTRALQGLENDPRFKIFVGWLTKSLEDSHEFSSLASDTFCLTKLAGACYTVRQLLDHIGDAGDKSGKNIVKEVRYEV